MQRRHSSNNTDGMPSERSRTQTLGSESSLDEGGVFDSVSSDPSTSPQQIFSGLVGVPSSAVSPAQFQAAGLVLGSLPEAFLPMAASSREEGAPHRPEGASFLPRPPVHHHHHHHFHHQALQHRSSSLLQQAAAGSGSERHGSREETQDDQSAPAPAFSELKAIVGWLQKGLPFIIILTIKLCIQHKLGITIGVALCCTFVYANSTFKHQVSLREKRSVLFALWMIVFLMGNIVYIYHTFSQEQLYNCLMFMMPNVSNLEFFELIWLVGITDFVLKFITISLKSFILSLPKFLLAFKIRGKLYLVIEELSQLVRALVPTQLWYKYIMEDNPSQAFFLAAALFIVYSVSKFFDICGRLSGLRNAFRMLCTAQSYGVRAGSQQCSEAGDVCAICQDEFKDPIILLCQHVFCEECLCVWFDRERTCPMCRSTIIETPCSWKDGTTSAHLQVY